MEKLGLHALARIEETDFDDLNNGSHLYDVFLEVIRAHKLEALSPPIVHQFQPQGLTGIVLLAESHISIHTWPEKGMATLDVFTCGDRSSREIAQDFADWFGCRKVTIQLIER